MRRSATLRHVGVVIVKVPSPRADAGWELGLHPTLAVLSIARRPARRCTLPRVHLDRTSELLHTCGQQHICMLDASCCMYSNSPMAYRLGIAGRQKLPCLWSGVPMTAGIRLHMTAVNTRVLRSHSWRDGITLRNIEQLYTKLGTRRPQDRVRCVPSKRRTGRARGNAGPARPTQAWEAGPRPRARWWFAPLHTAFVGSGAANDHGGKGREGGGGAMATIRAMRDLVQ